MYRKAQIGWAVLAVMAGAWNFCMHACLHSLETGSLYYVALTVLELDI